jgi:hypothetical protein
MLLNFLLCSKKSLKLTGELLCKELICMGYLNDINFHYRSQSPRSFLGSVGRNRIQILPGELNLNVHCSSLRFYSLPKPPSQNPRFQAWAGPTLLGYLMLKTTTK